MSSATRVRSLWDMLKRFETEHVLSAFNYISQTERKVRSDLEEMRRLPGGPGNCTYSIEIGEQRKNLLGAINNLRKAGREYQIPGLRRAVDSVEDFLCGSRDFSRLDYGDTVRLHAALHALCHTTMHVLDDMSIFILTHGSADYVVGSKVGFGKSVETAFPSSTYDSHEASKCLGLERWTACVMHCMCALEPALLALEKAVPVKVSKEQWGDKINQIEAAIKAMNKGTHSKAEVQWFADAATQFHFIKNAWRNYAHHLLHTYDEERATEIYSATRTFMRHLSGGLAEPSAG